MDVRSSKEGIQFEMNTLVGQREWCKRLRKLQKRNEVAQQFEENERGAHR